MFLLSHMTKAADTLRMEGQRRLGLPLRDMSPTTVSSSGLSLQ